MNLFDADQPRTITRLAPTKDGWVSVYANQKRVSRVPSNAVPGLRIEIGTAWTGELEHQCTLAAETWRAKRKAVALIRVRPRGASELTTRLRQAGYGPEAAGAAVQDLTAQGLVDDAALAEVAAARAVDKGLSSAATAARLAARGLGDAAPPPPAGSELDRAMEVARNRAGKMPESLDAATRANRLLSALARLGYDEETAREAVQRVLGFQDE